ncbi:MAG: TatD family hydrolase [Selenomonadales bacterium]|nr:TatD family hydrolase [Selenomonadales bacterium]
MLVDTHAHIDEEGFAQDFDEMLERAYANDVKYVVNIGANMDESRVSIELADKYESIYATVGVHPHDVAEVDDKALDKLAKWCEHDKVVAVGEIGLDYFRSQTSKEMQAYAFAAQLDVARQMHMPVSIHDRDAHGDVMRMLKNEGKGINGILHCFSGSWEMAKELIKMDYYIAIGGAVTFKNAAKLPEIAANIPLEYLLLETDCPYLAPHPHRGTRNEPANIRPIAEFIANIRGITLEELAAATTANAARIMRMPILK